ncbi:MAG TPA: hypothetical protein VKS81_11785 [Bacteroidota bacterium]|nr:hypothetical protein [Bacteroidota bacterium]
MSIAGAHLSIRTNDSSEIKGDLLLITDSVLVITRLFNAREDFVEQHLKEIEVVRLDKITAIKLCGRSFTSDGLLLGAAAGLAVGTLLDYEPHGISRYDVNTDPVGPGAIAIVYCGLGGMAIGAFLGAEEVTHDEELDLNDPVTRRNLIDMARYRNEPPEWLKKLMQE